MTVDQIIATDFVGCPPSELAEVKETLRQAAMREGRSSLTASMLGKHLPPVYREALMRHVDDMLRRL